MFDQSTILQLLIGYTTMLLIVWGMISWSVRKGPLSRLARESRQVIVIGVIGSSLIPLLHLLGLLYLMDTRIGPAWLYEEAAWVSSGGTRRGNTLWVVVIIGVSALVSLVVATRLIFLWKQRIEKG